MTPLEIDILLHYHCRSTDYRDGDFSAPSVREAIDRFCLQEGLLQYRNTALWVSGEYPQTYELTERGRVYVAALQEVPLPVQKWVMAA